MFTMALYLVLIAIWVGGFWVQLASNNYWFFKTLFFKPFFEWSAISCEDSKLKCQKVVLDSQKVSQQVFQVDLRENLKWFSDSDG